MKKISLILLLLLLAVTAQAGTYKWKDKNGQVHYGENPPLGVDAQLISGKPNPIVEDRARRKKEKQRKAEEKKKAAHERKRARSIRDRAAWEKENNRRIQKACESTEADLARLQLKRRFRIKDGNTYRYMTDKERAERIKKARDFMRVNCQN